MAFYCNISLNMPHSQLLLGLFMLKGSARYAYWRFSRIFVKEKLFLKFM